MINFGGDTYSTEFNGRSYNYQIIAKVDNKGLKFWVHLHCEDRYLSATEFDSLDESINWIHAELWPADRYIVKGVR